jgi:hypothetical protein
LVNIVGCGGARRERPKKKKTDHWGQEKGNVIGGKKQ